VPDWKETLNPATEVLQGRKLVASAGTRETLGSAVTKAVTIQALEPNTGHVVIGGASVVAATATPVTLEVDNLHTVDVDARVAAQGVSFTYLR
jgi:hypothetical protein